MTIEERENIKITLDKVCGKWKAVILMELVGKTLRFSEIKQQLQQINHQTLIKQLKELEHDGLVLRHAYAVVPPKVEYSLTGYGESLESLLRELEKWGREHKMKMEEEGKSSSGSSGC
ncbi:transcriptional regulator, HxlR family [Marinococcus luteus]|uniref:Transcriptional regulator, HxlR family n=1 Tax=Marinococcus luteus TaxID=1122204 RepID=A0A1H2X507_9BACI|nr:helix-turn-helix domain-containing protein [Marinococcus luteus]SDW87867.1 transcriptional regulator, HxlR family [Marinococcus luteus]